MALQHVRDPVVSPSSAHASPARRSPRLIDRAARLQLPASPVPAVRAAGPSRAAAASSQARRARAGSTNDRAGTAFALRVDCAGASDAWSVVDWLKQCGGSYAVVAECEGQNSHVHAILFDTRRIEAIRQDFRRKLPQFAGNSAYSLTLVTDIDKYERYIAKGTRDDGPDVVSTYGVLYDSPEFWADRHLRYWDENENIERARRARSVGSVLDEALAIARHNSIIWSREEELAKIILRIMRERNKAVNTFQVRSQVNLLMMHLCPDDQALDRLASAVVSRS